MIISDRIFHIHCKVDVKKRVTAYRCLIDGLWTVEQEGKTIITCSNLFLRDVIFNHKEGTISGNLSSCNEIKKLHELAGHDKDECFMSKIISLDMDGFKVRGDLIDDCPFLDMVSDDELSLIAIYPNKKVWAEL